VQIDNFCLICRRLEGILAHCDADDLRFRGFVLDRSGLICRKTFQNAEGAMPTKNVELTKRQADLIEALVESGCYENASEVVREGLRLVEQRVAEDARKLEMLRDAVRVGVEAMDRGEFKEFESIEDLRAYLHKLSEKVISGATE
jgi:antitoxin ParD1/3/4